MKKKMSDTSKNKKRYLSVIPARLFWDLPIVGTTSCGVVISSLFHLKSSGLPTPPRGLPSFGGT